MQQLSQFRIVSLGLQVLLLFIGALTLGIAGIGLMNIMLVSVQQRTREIGVEKALGARKRHILLQRHFFQQIVAAVIGQIEVDHHAIECGGAQVHQSFACRRQRGHAHRRI